MKNSLTFHLKIPHIAGFEKFLKNSSQCWIYPGKNPTLWGIFVELEQNQHWHQCQRSQRCHQKLQRFQKSNFVRNKWKTVSLFISKFLTMQDFKSFWKIPHNVGFILKKIQPFWHHLHLFYSIGGGGVFQNSSQCRIRNVFENFLTMLDLSM